MEYFSFGLDYKFLCDMFQKYFVLTIVWCHGNATSLVINYDVTVYISYVIGLTCKYST